MISRRILLAALAAAALLQCFVIGRSPVVGKDSVTFIAMAKALAEDPRAAVENADQHPGFPAMVLLGTRTVGRLATDDPVGRWIIGGRVFPWIGGVVSVLLVWLLARRALGDGVAAAAVSVFTVMPLFRGNACDVMSDTPWLAFYLTGAWCLVEGVARTMSSSEGASAYGTATQALWFAGAGAASALAYLIRPEGLTVAVVGSGILVWMLFRRDTRRFAMGALLVLALLAALAIIPYVAIKGTLTSKKDVLVLVDRLWGSFREGAPAPPAPAGSSLLVGLLLAFNDLADVMIKDGLRYILAVPLLLVIRYGGQRRAHPAARRVFPALAGCHVFLLVLLFLIAGYMSHRHVMVLSALLMPWIGQGLIVAGELLHRGCRRLGGLPGRMSNEGAIILVVLCVVLGFLPRTIRPLYQDRVPLMRAGLWVRENTRQEDRILTNSHHAFLYSHRTGRLVVGSPKPLPELGQEHPPYEIIVLDGGHRVDTVGSLLKQASKRYVERTVTGVSGGERGVVIMEPRSPGR